MNDLIIGLRHVRPLGLSGFELLLTGIGGVLISHFSEKPFGVKEWVIYLLVIFFIGIIAHAMVGAHTQLNYWLGISKCPPDLNSVSGIFECPV